MGWQKSPGYNVLSFSKSKLDLKKGTQIPWNSVFQCNLATKLLIGWFDQIKLKLIIKRGPCCLPMEPCAEVHLTSSGKKDIELHIRLKFIVRNAKCLRPGPVASLQQQCQSHQTRLAATQEHRSHRLNNSLLLACNHHNRLCTLAMFLHKSPLVDQQLGSSAEKQSKVTVFSPNYALKLPSSKQFLTSQLRNERKNTETKLIRKGWQGFVQSMGRPCPEPNGTNAFKIMSVDNMYNPWQLSAATLASPFAFAFATLSVCINPRCHVSGNSQCIIPWNSIGPRLGSSFQD